MNTGALHPAPVRQATTPCPYSAPRINAPFTRPGTTATHTAFRAISLGTALSGTDMISSIVVLAALSRASSLCPSSAARAVSAIPIITTDTPTSFFIHFLLFCEQQLVGGRISASPLLTPMGSDAFLRDQVDRRAPKGLNSRSARITCRLNPTLGEMRISVQTELKPRRLGILAVSWVFRNGEGRPRCHAIARDSDGIEFVAEVCCTEHRGVIAPGTEVNASHADSLHSRRICLFTYIAASA